MKEQVLEFVRLIKEIRTDAKQEVFNDIERSVFVEHLTEAQLGEYNEIKDKHLSTQSNKKKKEGAK